MAKQPHADIEEAVRMSRSEKEVTFSHSCGAAYKKGSYIRCTLDKNHKGNHKYKPEGMVIKVW